MTTKAGSETGSAQSQDTGGSPVKRLIRPVRLILLMACVLQAIGSAAGVVPFIAVAELGRVLLGEGGPDVGRAWTVAGIGAGALVVRLALLMAAAALTHLADVAFQYDLRQKMVARLEAVPLGWFTERSSGAIKKAMQDDVSALHHMVGHSYTNLVGAVVTPLVAVGYLAWVDWRMTLASILPIAIGMALYGLQFRGYGEKVAAYGRALGDVNAASVEFIQGIAVVKTFGQSQKAFIRFKERAQAFVDYFWSWVSGLLPLAAATEVVLSPPFALVAVLAAGLLLVGLELMPALDLLPFAVLAPGLAAPFLTLAYAQNDMMLAKKAARRICSLLDTPVLPRATNPVVPTDSRVTYEGVCFSYDGKAAALQDIDLVLEPGTVTALVGPSGSGKSTLARLLPRFWDPAEGQIRIGGVPLQDMSGETLYRSLAFVFQDVQLPRASLRENIALARPGASLEDVERAARAAQIHDRILSLPRGYDTLVGDDVQLSGGEAQRVSIARAILADAPILVLDEATAFADPESEAAIQDALSRLAAGRTVLVVAHRLHTVVGADQICVMDEGRIVALGKHAALLEKSALYARLWAASEAALGGEPAVSA